MSISEAAPLAIQVGVPPSLIRELPVGLIDKSLFVIAGAPRTPTVDDTIAP